MNNQLSVIILCGGLNTRMGGKNKSFLSLGSETFLEKIYNTVSPIFSEILLATREPQLYKDINAKIVNDIFYTRSPLTGIHAGLVYANYDKAFVIACDMPFVNRKVIQRLVVQASTKYDVIVPKKGPFYEPLCAVYSKRCIKSIEYLLANNKVKISNLFEMVRTKEISTELLEDIDPELNSFININNLNDVQKIQNLIGDEYKLI